MFINTSDDVQLWVEECGNGIPILFIHEFGGNYDSWQPQIHAFSRRYRCITYAARGYPPSSVPTRLEAYSQQRAAEDALAVLDGLGIRQAHIVGLSMGGFTALHVGLNAPERALSLTIAGAGYGCEAETEAYFRQVSLQVGENFARQGAPTFAKTYALGASRVQFKNKDPLGWQRFADRLAEHDSVGASLTMQGVQARRPAFYQLEAQIRALQLPVLIMAGDEDDHCLQPGLYLKRHLPAAGLAILPKTGHTLNLEEPQLFNLLLAEFFAQVESGNWGKRDPRANPAQIMPTD